MLSHNGKTGLKFQVYFFPLGQQGSNILKQIIANKY